MRFYPRSQLSSPRRESGFTLLELMAVIMIIGTLATIAIPSVIDKKKDNIDQQTQNTVQIVANELKTYEARGNLSNKATLETVKEEFTKSASRGTVLTLERTLNGYCLSGYNENGNNAVNDPILFDSELNHGKGDVTTSTTANCQSKSLVGDSYTVNGKKQLERLETPTAPANGVCSGVIPGAYANTDQSFYVQTVQPAGSPSHIAELIGNLELSSDCKNVNFTMRVKNTTIDADLLSKGTIFRSYLSTKHTTGSAVTTNSDFMEFTLVGNQTLTGSMPTGWDTQSHPETLNVHGLSTDKFMLDDSLSNWTVGGSL